MRNEIEMMRVLRVPPLGKLVIAVGEHRIETLAEVSDPKAKQRLLAAIGELIVVAGGYQELVNAGVAPPLNVPQPTAPREETETAVTTTAAIEEQRRFLAQLEAQRDAYRAGSRSASVPSPSSVASTPTSAAVQQAGIIAQIDAILQRYIMADPELASRTIYLAHNPAGGLRIHVDGRYYERPREIPDLKIQQIIKQALKEWEST